MSMTIHQYVQSAIRTKSQIFSPQSVDINAFNKALREAAEVGNAFKVIKKAVFAGKGTYETQEGSKTLVSACFEPDSLHAVCGVLNEAGEIAEAISKRSNGQAIDWDNLDEEFGDLLWFWALYCHARGIDPEEIMCKNIAKLRARFPEKFDPEKNEQRDLGAERAAMSDVSNRSRT